LKPTQKEADDKRWLSQMFFIFGFAWAVNRNV